MPMETSHIWLGTFPSERVFDEYFEEQYDDDEAPINKFAEDQGESYYDHDWVERSFQGSVELNVLIKDHSYSVDYIDQVIGSALEIGVVDANSFIMADAGEFDEPKSIQSGGYTIWYIGTYNCNV